MAETDLRTRQPTWRATGLSGRSPLSALGTSPAVRVARTATLGEVVEIMREHSVSAVVVDVVSGIVTERDLARALGAGRAASDPVAAVAASHTPTVSASTTVLVAARRMLDERVRELVVDDGGSLGVVSMDDLLGVVLGSEQKVPWGPLGPLPTEAPETWLG